MWIKKLRPQFSSYPRSRCSELCGCFVNFRLLWLCFGCHIHGETQPPQVSDLWATMACTIPTLYQPCYSLYPMSLLHSITLSLYPILHHTGSKMVCKGWGQKDSQKWSSARLLHHHQSIFLGYKLVNIQESNTDWYNVVWHANWLIKILIRAPLTSLRQ